MFIIQFEEKVTHTFNTGHEFVFLLIPTKIFITSRIWYVKFIFLVTLKVRVLALVIGLTKRHWILDLFQQEKEFLLHEALSVIIINYQKY